MPKLEEKKHSFLSYIWKDIYENKSKQQIEIIL